MEARRSDYCPRDRQRLAQADGGRNLLYGWRPTGNPHADRRTLVWQQPRDLRQRFPHAGIAGHRIKKLTQRRQGAKSALCALASLREKCLCLTYLLNKLCTARSMAGAIDL